MMRRTQRRPPPPGTSASRRMRGSCTGARRRAQQGRRGWSQPAGHQGGQGRSQPASHQGRRWWTTTGPHRKEEVVEAQGHRAPYGVEEVTRARGGEESESEDDRGRDKPAHGAATTMKTHRKAHAGGGVRSPQVLPELFGGQVLPHRPAKKPRGENGAEALPIFPRPPSVDGVVWPDGRRNRHEDQPHGPCRRGEEEPPRVGYGDGAPRGNDKATAFAAMLVRVTMSAQRTGDKEAAAVALTTTPRRRMALPRADESNDDAHQGARRRPPHATKVARRTGVDEAAFALTMDDAKDDDDAPRDEDSDNGANDDADDNAERGAKPRAAGTADDYGARRVRATSTPHDSDDTTVSKDNACTDKAVSVGETRLR